ncbi:MAG: hypothetical protein AB1773_06510 [Pseudomonadota bacterium]
MIRDEAKGLTVRLFSRLMKAFSRAPVEQQLAGESRTTERLAKLERLRTILEVAFSRETASPGTETQGRPPSAGQCAAVSVIVWDRFGGEFVSATVQGQSHWFNRLNIGGRVIDVDLTGDQFGLKAVRFGKPGSLWAGTRLRTAQELREETVRRAILLAEKAGLKDTQKRLLSLLNSAAAKVRTSDLDNSARER